jgi:hypothetical protein
VTKGATARVLRDAGCLVALAGIWVLLWVALVTARHGWGPDMGGMAALLFGALGLVLLVTGAVLAAVAGFSATRAGGGPASRPRLAVAAIFGAVTLASGLYVSAVWARRLVRERAENVRMKAQARLQEEDRARRAAIWDANGSRLRESLQRCLAAPEPPAGISVSGVSAADREALESALRESLPAYRLASEREIACVRAVAFQDRFSSDGDERAAAWAVAGSFEGDASEDGAEEIVALATKTDALELDPILFRKGVPPLVERRNWPGRPAVLLGRVRPASPPKLWPPPERDHPGRIYDVVSLAILERPLTGPTVPLVRLQWMQVRVVRGVDGKSYVGFDSGDAAAMTKTEAGRP